MLTAISLSFLTASVDYMIKFQFFFQTTYRAYTIHCYKKIHAEGPTTVLGVQDREGDRKVTAVSITIDRLTGA